MSSARDITLRQPIVICPWDQQACKEEMKAIEAAALEAAQVNPNNPPIPPGSIVLANDPHSLHHLGLCLVGDQKKPLIE